MNKMEYIYLSNYYYIIKLSKNNILLSKLK